MKRSIERGIAEGKQLVKGHERLNMDVSELIHFVNEYEAQNSTGIADTVYNSFLFGVAVGSRISKSNRRRTAKNETVSNAGQEPVIHSGSSQYSI